MNGITRKTCPKRPQGTPRRPKRARGAAKGPHQTPKRHQRDPTRQHRGPKRTPRDPKGTPGQPKETPRVDKGTPKGRDSSRPTQTPRNDQGSPKGPQWTPKAPQRDPQESPNRRPRDPKERKDKTNDFAAEWQRYHQGFPQHSNVLEVQKSRPKPSRFLKELKHFRENVRRVAKGPRTKSTAGRQKWTGTAKTVKNTPGPQDEETLTDKKQYGGGSGQAWQ